MRHTFCCARHLQTPHDPLCLSQLCKAYDITCPGSKLLPSDMDCTAPCRLPLPIFSSLCFLFWAWSPQKTMQNRESERLTIEAYAVCKVYHSVDPGSLIKNMTMLATQKLEKYMGHPADLGAGNGFEHAVLRRFEHAVNKADCPGIVRAFLLGLVRFRTYVRWALALRGRGYMGGGLIPL